MLIYAQNKRNSSYFGGHYMVSKKFLRTIKTAGRPAYKIAHEAGIPPNSLYKIMAGIDIPKDGDHRVIAVGQVLGLQDAELFEVDTISFCKTR